MYREFFNFTDRPFRVTPQVDSYCAVEPMEEARASLVRAIERCEGPGLLIGPTGCGKSLLCHLLADHFRETHQLVFLESSQICTRRALLQHLLFEVDQPCTESSEGGLRIALRRLLRATGEYPNGMVIIVDEADKLPMSLLEELRMLTNFVVDGHSRVQLVLSGSPRLEENFNEPRMDSFNQRLACRCYLRSLKRDETIRYIQGHLERVGGEISELFSPEALISLYELTDGIPRLVNQLCDHALLLAAEKGCRCLESEDMEIAWADLQQLPVPVRLEPADTTTDGEVVEFGELDDAGFTALPPLPGEDSATVQFGALDDEPAMDDSRTVTSDRPSEEIDRPSEEIDRPSEEMDRPSEEMDRPSEEMDRPSEEMDRPSEEMEPARAEQIAPLLGNEDADELEAGEPAAWNPPDLSRPAARDDEETGSPFPTDDRDMIVIQNGQHLSVHDESEQAGKPHLRLYRELFDRLRQSE